MTGEKVPADAITEARASGGPFRVKVSRLKGVKVSRLKDGWVIHVHHAPGHFADGWHRDELVLLDDEWDDLVSLVAGTAAAQAAAAERERIRQLAIDRKATWLKPCDRDDLQPGRLHTHHRMPFADMLDGAP
jgi:hypothetical protein